jgi:3-phosphoshikimate 1-carboxyvinyltransferase
MIQGKKNYLLRHTPKLNAALIHLPSSKSESNRALIIQALADGQVHLSNLSEARDTQTMMRLLSSPAYELDVLDAGTVMRFITAFCALTGKKKLITGVPRMQERPIKLLVNALRELGADVHYLKKDGYPPVETRGFAGQLKEHVFIRGDVSSQYISALLMTGAILPKGLRLSLTGKIGSRPYIDMTLALMKKFGAAVDWENDNTLWVQPKPYHAADFSVESDWSGASYWFSMVALAEQASITLHGLKPDSLQGDISIIKMMDKLGVAANFVSGGLYLTKSEHASEAVFDFSDSPDLAQTVAVCCAAKGVRCTMTGLESLRIKETDRVAALQKELAKMGAQLQEHDKRWTLIPAEDQGWRQHAPVTFHTYDDHRMAMAFAPLATMVDIVIENPDVVEKSYPRFWEDLALAGVSLSEQGLV